MAERTMAQTSLFGDRHEEAKARMWAEIHARQTRIRRLAGEARSKAFHEWFIQRAREFNGLRGETRAQVIAEATEVGKHAAEQVYLAHGYTRCNPTLDVCDRLVTPGFDLCPDHAPISA